MIARRQVFLSLLSLMAASTVPAAARASLLFDQTRFPPEPGEEGLLPTGGESFSLGTVIKVIGVGGAGGNIVDHMIASKTQGIEFIYANTDVQAMSRSAAHKTVQLGSTGSSAGRNPDQGREAALASEQDIRRAIDGANMLFITAGMGGGTGTGAAPVIARIAKEMGILTVGLVTKPFDWEGEHRMSDADEGLVALEANVDSLIVLSNGKLLDVLGDDITLDGAFAYANDVMKNAVGGIAEIINVPGLVNVDFEDVRIVLSVPGKAMVGTAVAIGNDRARVASEQALACPLRDGVDLAAAKAVLVLVSTSKPSLRLSESRLAMNTIRAHGSADAHFIYGTAHDDNLGEKIRVTVVAAGVKSGA